MPDVQSGLVLPWGYAGTRRQGLVLPWGYAGTRRAFGSAYTAPAAPPGSSESVAGDLTAATALGAADSYRQAHTMAVTDLRTGGSLRLDGVRLSLDDGSALWSLNASARDPAVYLALAGGEQPATIEIEIDGLTWRFVVENLQRPRSFGQRACTFNGRSLAAAADRPYQFDSTYSAESPTTAAQLASAALAAAGVELEWKLADWLIPAGAVSLRGTPLDVVRALAAAVGAVVTAHRTEPRITVESRYPLLPNEWAYAPPDVQIHSQAVETQSEERTDQPAWTGVFVAGQQSGALGYVRLEGTSGADQAPTVTDPLLTDGAALTERGRAVLGSAGRQARVTRRLPVRTGSGEPGVIARGALLRCLDVAPADEGGALSIWHGLVRSVTVEAALPVVRQTVAIERHLEWSVQPDTSEPLVLSAIPDQFFELGVPFALDLSAFRSGGAAPYTWAQRAGTLPPGLTLDAEGETISGTASTVASYPGHVLRVTDGVARMQESNAFAFHVTPLDDDILLWLRAESALGTSIPVDSSPYARVPYGAAGTVTDAQTKCGNSVFGTTGGFDVKYSAAEFPPFEASPFRISFHWYWAGGDATAVLVARMVQGESSSFGRGWRLIASAGTGFIFQSLNGSGITNSRQWNASTSTGLWRYLDLQYTGSDLELYLNEVKLTPSATTGTPVPRLEAGAEFHIGHGRDALATVNGGYIDEFRVLVGSQLAVPVSAACPV